MTRIPLNPRSQVLVDFLEGKGAPKPSKYRNKPTEADGHKFGSLKERRRYDTLRLLERAGEIRDLQMQPRFPLKVGGALVCTYIGDFSYRANTPHGDHDTLIVEDVKSAFTRKNPVYRIKFKLFRALMGFEISEV